MMELKTITFIAFISLGTSLFSQTDYQSELIGKNVSELEFYNSDGGTIKLGSFSGTYVYIDFWHSHWASLCECVEQISTGGQLMKEKGFENFKLINISLDFIEKDWKEKGYADKISNESSNLWIGPLNRFKTLDQANEFTKKWQLNRVPQYWIVDPQGNILEVDRQAFK